MVSEFHGAGRHTDLFVSRKVAKAERNLLKTGLTGFYTVQSSVISAEAGIHNPFPRAGRGQGFSWIPAYAGMTIWLL